jgi:hypothetical protein
MREYAPRQTILGDIERNYGCDGLGAEHSSVEQPLDAEAVMAAALQRSGRNDFSDRSFVRPLKRLLRSYAEEADLNPFGLRAVRFDVMRSLTNILLFDAAEECHPEITRRQLRRPIFITGFPRSASTFLHKLLSLDRSLAVPRSWELIFPYSRSPLASRWRKIQVGLQLRTFQFLAPEVAQLHPMGANEPQECIDITAQVFQSTRFDSTFRVPSYQHCLKEYGYRQAYRFHHRFLQHLDAAYLRRRWVLKAPDHIYALDALHSTYPDADLIFLHRDPLRVVASAAKLTEALQRPFTRSLDRYEIGQRVSSSLIDAAGRMAKAVSGSNTILNLHYRDVVARPMQTVALIYRHCGLVLSCEAEVRMRRWLSGQTDRRRNYHRYELADYGLDARELLREFAPYRETFAALFAQAGEGA